MRHLPGPLLVVNLDDREAWTEDVSDVTEQYVGGRGVATRLAHERIPFDADPLGPENRLFFAVGPLQTTTTSFAGRTNLTGVSPLTGGLLSSNVGGYLSRNLASTGYAAVELRGASDDLVAVHVTDDGVEFEDVPELADALVPAVSRRMAEAHDLDAAHLATVGPAGEHGVRFASVMTYDHRAFGRGGLGAVLGAKGVKCVSFDGDSEPTLDVPECALSAIDEAAATSDDPKRTQGTPSTVNLLNDEYSLPTRYFSEQSFEGADELNGDAVEAKKYEKATCSDCVFACKLPTRDEETGIETEGPEYEATFSLGANVGVGDLVDVMQSNDLCDALGLDVISCGDAIAAYLASEDAFGDADHVHDLVTKIAYRKGVGDVLAEGVSAAADEFGVRDWTVKNLGFPGHDGRVLHGQGLSYAVANRGADHLYASVLSDEYGDVPEDTLDGKPELVVQRENERALEDAAIACTFSGGNVTDEQYEALLDASMEELRNVGARIVTLERHFNNERGFDRGDDRLPFDLPGLAAAIDEYYERRGWNDDGTVPEQVVP
jgi:aldehyde:ferredoxin oxidoreductase